MSRITRKSRTSPGGRRNTSTTTIGSGKYKTTQSSSVKTGNIRTTTSYSDGKTTTTQTRSLGNGTWETLSRKVTGRRKDYVPRRRDRMHPVAEKLVILLFTLFVGYLGVMVAIAKIKDAWF